VSADEPKSVGLEDIAEEELLRAAVLVLTRIEKLVAELVQIARERKG
jgi:hypothetical protein